MSDGRQQGCASRRRVSSTLLALAFGSASAFGSSAIVLPVAATPPSTEAATSTATSTATPTPTPTTTGSPSPTSSPTPSPTQTPTPDPTDEPTEEPSDEPTQEPTDEPSESPTDGPSEEPPTDGPTSPPEEPEPTPTETEDPDKAYEDALKDAQTTAVAEAQRLIQQSLAAIGEAEVSLADARADAEAARTASEEAARQLAITEESVARTKREIRSLVQEQEETRRTIGAVAAEAYQGTGTTTTMDALFSSESPADLTNQYVGLNHLLRANDHALGTMAASQADLRNAEVTLDAQLAESRQRADEAEQKAASTADAEEAAEAAQADLEDQNAQLEHALDLAEQAKIEDYQRYMELIGESTQLGELLRDKDDYGPGYGTGDFVRPATGDFTSRYGQRRHPILGYVKMHTGLDFGRGNGDIYAADSGTVLKAEWNDAYGYMVVIDHGEIDGNRISTMYAHQPNLSVSAGQRVEKGQRIGSIGSTGYSTGPHLHFEVYVDGEHTDPMPWIEGAPSPS